MDQRISLVTLGVADLARSIAFYERLGWKRADGPADVAFFQAGGMIVALWSRELLAKDAKVENSNPGFSGISLAHNLRSKPEVDAVMAEAKAAGATILKPAEDVFWGGYSGYFADPAGHVWEVAWNPFWTIMPDGSVSLTPPA